MIEQSVPVRVPPAPLVPRSPVRSAGPWLWVSVAAASIAAAGSVVALTGPGDVYGEETPAFVDQAVAQAVVDLAVVTPALVVAAWMARRGSLVAYPVWLGALSFTVYNHVIYTLSVHAGPLFLPWVAVLGLSLYALIGGLASVDPRIVRARFVRPHRRTAGWFLIVVAALFSALWLKDIVPAILSGDVPDSARERGLPSNPAHVLDLVVYLPAAFAAGLLLLRDRAWAYASAPGMLVFVGLTGMPILLTPFVADARGGTPGWAVLPPLGAVTIVSLALAVRLLSAARHPIGGPAGTEEPPT